MQDINNLNNQFQLKPQSQQLKLIPQLVAAGEAGLTILMDYLIKQKSLPANVVMGTAYMALYRESNPETKNFLMNHFPQGVVNFNSEQTLDYQPLQQLLIKEDFQAADTLTRELLCELAGEGAKTRKWLYFTEVNNIPVVDLQTIDLLWQVYSEGKFGFSVQREMWLALGKDFTKLWSKIHWQSGINWTKYPEEFTWDLTAPKGHLPLSNQLRGVRVISAIFSHPAWSKVSA